MEHKEFRKFKDLFPNEIIEGKQVSIESVLDKDLLIKGFVLREGDYGEYAVIQFEDLGEEAKLRTTQTGAKIILRYLKKIKELNKFPFLAQIIREDTEKGQYYLFK